MQQLREVLRQLAAEPHPFGRWECAGQTTSQGRQFPARHMIQVRHLHINSTICPLTGMRRILSSCTQQKDTSKTVEKASDTDPIS